jgi:hypothetical protein
MSPAEGRRQRASLMRAIARDLKAKNRAKLLELRGRVRALRAEARAELAGAIDRCRKGRKLPTVRQLAAELRDAKRAARVRCDAELKVARAVRGEAKRAREVLAAEKKYQRDLRRIEAGNRRKLAAEKKRPGLARARRGESDDEVEGNIPPELVALWRRVRGSIKGSDRKSRTEAFLQYAEEHPAEEWAALEDSVDRAIAEMERRQAMPNPKRKKNVPRLTAKQSRKRFAKLKKAGCHPRRVRLPSGEAVVIRDRSCKVNPRGPKRPPPGSIKQGDLFMAPSGQLVLVEPSHEQRVRTAKSSAASRTLPMFEGRKNPRRPPRKWWRRCLSGVEARRYARDPAAVCGAAWWRMPPRQREAIVRKLERGSRRERRTAVAIAKAERNRSEGPARRVNGAMGDRAAAREYTRSHWGDPGRRSVRELGAANPKHGTAVRLGTLRAVHYEAVKGKKRGEIVIWEHDFEGRRPTLVYNEGGLMIAGGDYVVSEAGIEG